MRKFLYIFLSVVLFVNCSTKEEEKCSNTGVPPARFIFVIKKDISKAQDFLSTNNQIDNSVHFYRIDRNTKETLETSYSETSESGDYISIRLNNINTISTGTLQTFYLNNKGTPIEIQVKINTEHTECEGNMHRVNELIIDGEKRNANFLLEWSPFINYENKELPSNLSY
ncbi:MAG: hypothetical protein Q3983_09795 [Capnocytophaga sp.]|nr:hypothetical protein [Capnocytophaga sp.]